MRVNQEITERIRYVERFEVLVSGKSTRLPSPEYPFSRAANRQMPISRWLQTRFTPTYPSFYASVIYPDGSTVRPDIPIGVVRDAYQECSNVYGQSMRFSFVGDNESSILKIKNTLDKARIDTNFSRPSFLWLWQWFTLEGEISHIHLPLFYRLALSDMLNSFTPSEGISFKFQFNSDGCHLFEAEADYSYFGIEQFQSLKAITG